MQHNFTTKFHDILPRIAKFGEWAAHMTFTFLYCMKRATNELANLRETTFSKRHELHYRKNSVLLKVEFQMAIHQTSFFQNVTEKKLIRYNYIMV